MPGLKERCVYCGEFCCSGTIGAGIPNPCPGLVGTRPRLRKDGVMDPLRSEIVPPASLEELDKHFDEPDRSVLRVSADTGEGNSYAIAALGLMGAASGALLPRRLQPKDFTERARRMGGKAARIGLAREVPEEFGAETLTAHWLDAYDEALDRIEITLQTERFGEVRIKQSSVMTFELGLMQNPAFKQFALLPINNGGAFMVLQSLDVPALWFLVTLPEAFFAGYTDRIADREEVIVLTICQHETPASPPEGTQPKQQLFTNLRSPLIVNTKSRKGVQAAHPEHDKWSDKQPLEKPS